MLAIFKDLRTFVLVLLIGSLSVIGSCASEDSNAAGSYEDLLELFTDWRAFERPPMLDGAPDYTGRRLPSARRRPRATGRLDAIDPPAGRFHSRWTGTWCGPK